MSNYNEFFSDALTVGKRVVRQMGLTACDLADNAHLRIQIAEQERNLSRKYRKLGRMACNAMDSGELIMDEEMQAVYNEIAEVKQRIASLKEEL